MQTTKKKPSLIFILVGAVLAGYLGYLINGAWTKGIVALLKAGEYGQVPRWQRLSEYQKHSLDL